VAAAQIRARRAHDGIPDFVHDRDERMWGRRLYVDLVGAGRHAKSMAASGLAVPESGPTGPEAVSGHGAGSAVDAAGGGRGVGAGHDGGRQRSAVHDVSVRDDLPTRTDRCRRQRRSRRLGGGRLYRHVEELSVRHQQRPRRRVVRRGGDASRTRQRGRRGRRLQRCRRR